VQLIDSMGDDLAIVQAAQSSFGRQSEEYGSREQRILRALLRDEHGVPFEHVVLKYRLKLPIFVARQLVKHRMSSWSEHSGRYSQHEADFYVPTHDRVRTQTGKPMDYAYAPADQASASLAVDVIGASNHDSWELYQILLQRGVAREQARLVLPQTLYTVITWSINVRSLLNVLRLRADEHAQWEIQQYAHALEELAGHVVPDTLAAFNEFGRVAP
jgi:thymidylate synthase (FAD)